jgi:predicted ATPase
MFRGISQRDVTLKLEKYESDTIGSNVFLITLTAGGDFFLRQEDGNSFSQTLEQKEKELKLFKKVHHLSSIENKLLLKVDNTGNFRSKDKIFNEALDLIEGRNNEVDIEIS